VLVKVHRRGGITLIYLGDKAPDPSAYRAYAPQRRCWDDPMWASNLPANIEAPYTLILPRDPDRTFLRSLRHSG